MPKLRLECGLCYKTRLFGNEEHARGAGWTVEPHPKLQWLTRVLCRKCSEMVAKRRGVGPATNTGR